MSRRRFGHFLNAWSVSGLLLPLIAWEISAHIIRRVYPLGSTLVPTLEEILLQSLPGFATFDVSNVKGFGGTLSYSGAIKVLATQSFVTLSRVVIGTSAGFLLGVFIGLAMGWSRLVREFLLPIIQFLRTIPFLALIVLFILWFDGKDIGPLIYISFVVFATMVVITLEAIRNVPPVYTQFAQTLGASEFQIYKTVVMPAIVPSLVGAVRVVLSSAWAIVLAAEYLSVQNGLGRLMILSEMFFKTGRIVIVVLLFVAFSAAFNHMFLLWARRVTRWQPEG